MILLLTTGFFIPTLAQWLFHSSLLKRKLPKSTVSPVPLAECCRRGLIPAFPCHSTHSHLRTLFFSQNYAQNSSAWSSKPFCILSTLKHFFLSRWSLNIFLSLKFIFQNFIICGTSRLLFYPHMEIMAAELLILFN